ncbi:MAG TPA: hypothetical protein VF099_03535 [Ktedonobacterales bacterium]
MNKHSGLPFANAALICLMVGVLLSSMPICLVADALALMGWDLGLTAAVQRRHWQWALIIVGSSLALLLWAWSSYGSTIQRMLIQWRLGTPPTSLLFLTTLAAFALIPVILYASSHAGGEKEKFSPFDQVQQPDISNFGLVTLAIFFMVLIWRFGVGGIELAPPVIYR